MLLVNFLDYTIGVFFLWLICCVFYFGFKIEMTTDPFEKYGLVLEFIRYCSLGFIGDKNDTD